MKLTRWIPAALIGASLVACEESTTIGSSIIQDNVEVSIDSTFTVSGRSVSNPVIQARTDNQLLGRINARGYGQLSSDFITQFMPASSLDTTGVTLESIDSIKLRMFMLATDMIGDSLAPMGVEVYRLDKSLPSPIYSDFNPADSYNPADLLGSKMYTASVLGMSEQKQSSYTHPDTAIRILEVEMPLKLAHEFWNKFKEDPALWNNPQKFSKWFPGVYIKNSFGSGRIMRFYASGMYMYFKRHLEYDRDDGHHVDTIINGSQIFLAVTPEVINNNNMTYTVSSNIDAMAAEKPMLVAPIGYDTELTLPIRSMVEKYRHQVNKFDVLNSMTMSIPVEAVTNDYSIEPPEYVLLVKKDKKDDFFSKQQINDNISSFYAQYNADTNSYDFTDMRQYFLDMSKKENLTDADGDFILTPVNLVTETVQTGYYQTSSVVMAIVPYVNTPSMASLRLKDAKIKLTFSTQSLSR